MIHSIKYRNYTNFHIWNRADYMCAEEIKHLIKSKNVWWKRSSDLNFTEEENTIMRKLTNKQCNKF